MKSLKILILFVIVLSGCSRKYVDPGGKELICREWSVLDAKIVEQNDVGFTLNLNAKDFVEVIGSVEPDAVFRQDKEIRKKGFDVKNALIGCAIFGCAVPTISWLNSSTGSTAALEHVMPACIAGSCCIAGASVIIYGAVKNSKTVKVIPNFAKTNDICVDSILLSKQKIVVSIEEADFEGIYYTDENGNVELGFDEIIREPTEADSILNLIIQYYELVDTVEVRRL